MRRGRNAAGRLRAAVDMLPVETKRAMLAALDSETIVTGAYTHEGGVCPMLAAHRRGGRTDRDSFAKAWDRYTGADKGRRATEREIRTLRCMLEASLLEPFDIHAVERPKKRTRIAPPRRRRRGDDSPHTVSPGRVNWISGTMQAGEVDSRKRTASESTRAASAIAAPIPTPALLIRTAVRP